MQKKCKNGIHTHREHSERSKEIVAFNFVVDIVVDPDAAVMKLKYYTGCTDSLNNGDSFYTTNTIFKIMWL